MLVFKLFIWLGLGTLYFVYDQSFKLVERAALLVGCVFWVVKFYYVILEPFPLYCRGYHFEYQVKKYYSNSSLYLGYLFSTVSLVRSMGV